MALSADIGSTQQAKFGNIQAYTIGTINGSKIWRGALVAVRLEEGLIYPAIDDPSDTYKQQIVGFSMERGEEAGKKLRVRQDGRYLLKFPGCDQTCVGKLALLKDDETVQTYLEGVTKVIVGRIVEMYIEGESVYVDMTDRPRRLAESLYD